MTEQERFGRCLGAVLRFEGGYSEDPRDPGGATNLGITLATLSQALGRAATAEEVRALTPGAVAPIYQDRYWRPVQCGRLKPGLDFLAFDTAVNMGVGAAATLLQGALGVEADGAIGPVTLAAADRAHARQAIEAFLRLRAARYRSLDGFAVFGIGWMRRLEAAGAQAQAWADEPVGAGATA